MDAETAAKCATVRAQLSGDAQASHPVKQPGAPEPAEGEEAAPGSGAVWRWGRACVALAGFRLGRWKLLGSCPSRACDK